MHHKKYSNWVVPFFLASLVLVLDIFSKYFVQKYLPHVSQVAYVYPYGGIPVFENFLGIQFAINHATNSGAAWGILAEWQWWLVLFRIAFVIGISLYIFLYKPRFALGVPLGLILGGATGNVLDYYFYSHVIDMFHFVLWNYDYPVFNVADTSIFIGAFLLIITPNTSFKSEN